MKRHKQVFVFGLMFSVFLQFFSHTRAEEANEPGLDRNAWKNRPIEVSLISLISNPLKYRGKLVAVEGVLRMGHEDSAIFLSMEDADYLIVQNSLGIKYSKQVKFDPPLEAKSPAYFHKRRVRVIGTYDNSVSGYSRSTTGQLKDVNLVREKKPFP